MPDRWARERREDEEARRQEIREMTPIERMELAYRLFRLTREGDEGEGTERGDDENGSS